MMELFYSLIVVVMIILLYTFVKTQRTTQHVNYTSINLTLKEVHFFTVKS